MNTPGLPQPLTPLNFQSGGQLYTATTEQELLELLADISRRQALDAKRTANTK